jgi:hypothetical protein
MLLAMAWSRWRRAVPPEPVVDPSLDVGYGRLSMICEPPVRDVHRRIWEGAVPLISIDGAAHIELIWGTSDFQLPVGTHQVRIDIRPGKLRLDYKSIDRTVEIASQRVHRLKYQAPPIPGFTTRLRDL